MALDGAFLRHLKREIEETVLGAKVDKIYQPNKDELVLSMRVRAGTHKLLMSARANSARIHFTKFVPETAHAVHAAAQAADGSASERGAPAGSGAYAVFGFQHGKRTGG